MRKKKSVRKSHKLIREMEQDRMKLLFALAGLRCLLRLKHINIEDSIAISKMMIRLDNMIKFFYLNKREEH